MKEIWKDIPGYEGLYQASSLGRIKSIDRAITYSNRHNHIHKGKILIQRECTGGYLYAVLSKEGKVKNCRVHRLVASSFIPNPNNLPQVNHLDKNRKNNSVLNLQWCTGSENQIHSFTNGRSRDTKQLIEANKKPIAVIKDGKIIHTFNSLKECCKSLGMSNSCIRRVIKGERKHYLGYKFEYI